MRRKARIDKNQKAVTEQLRKIPGVTVAITSSLGKGFGDFLIGYKKVNYLIELKDGKTFKSWRKLTEHEEKFHSEWTGQIDVANSFEEVLKILGL